MLSSRTSKIGDGHWEHSSLDKNPVPNCESPRNGLSAETANALPGVRRSCAPCITPTRVLKKKDNHNKSKEGPPPPKKTQHIQRADRNVRGKNQRWMQNTKNKGKKKRDIHKPEVPSRIRRTPRARAREGTGGTVPDGAERRLTHESVSSRLWTNVCPRVFPFQ